MTRQLELIDTLLSEGRDEFTSRTPRPLGCPRRRRERPRAAQQERPGRQASKSHYAIRPFGALGRQRRRRTSALPSGRRSKAGAPDCLLSALSELGVLSHPSDDLRRVHATGQFSTVSRRPLRLVLEKPETIHLEPKRSRTHGARRWSGRCLNVLSVWTSSAAWNVSRGGRSDRGMLTRRASRDSPLLWNAWQAHNVASRPWRRRSSYL